MGHRIRPLRARVLCSLTLAPILWSLSKSRSQPRFPYFLIFFLSFFFLQVILVTILQNVYISSLILHRLNCLNIRSLAAFTWDLCGQLPLLQKANTPAAPCFPSPLINDLCIPIFLSTLWDFLWPPDLYMAWCSLSPPDTSDKIKWERAGEC